MTQRYADTPTDHLHPNEKIKDDSDYLRGTIAESLDDEVTGSVRDGDHQLTKFHGIYQQDDRDLRDERRKQKLEPAYQFMARLRLPGGRLSPDQWLKLDDLAQRYAGGTLRLTTRQTFQFHWVLKRDLKTTIAGVNQALIDTVAACGDVNRNVLATVQPEQSRLHEQAYDYAKAISERLLPESRAYYEIWLDRQRLALGPADEQEPLYGKTYLPRKFKTAVAIPPSNDVDVYANDLGFIAIADESGALAGFNVTVGGGLGKTDGETATYPRLAEPMGFCRPDEACDIAAAVVAVQRDWGDRYDRKHARLKYTLDDFGLAWFKQEVETRSGVTLGASRPVEFADNGDRLGWIQAHDGTWHYTQFIAEGRIIDRADYPLMSGLREIARNHTGDFRVTANQNLVIAGVSAEQKPVIDEILQRYGMAAEQQATALRRSSMACVAFPTCGLAMAESERYLPSLLDKIHGLMREAGIADTAIKVRMTGCPNGCARPYLGEIGFTGKAPGKYNLYLGAGWHGQRLNKLYRENISEQQILESLQPILAAYAAEGSPGEAFGDFCVRAGYIGRVDVAQRDFHANT